MTLDERLTLYAQKTESFLDRYLNTAQCVGQDIIIEAMRYSALAGGKRLRPALTMEFCRVCGGDPEDALPFAVALEMIHTYSLIHDDLPCMDNDDFRRGKPTNHKVYGEATAVLAGDALLTQAFELVTNPQYIGKLSPDRVLQATHCLAKEAGVLGMIGGQVLDLAAEHQTLDYESLIRLQDRKTSALMKAAAHMGCVIGEASPAQFQAAERYAEALGLAFQIQDDILDIEGESNVLGKPIGSDLANEKSTFPKLIGLAECHKKVHELTQIAIDSVKSHFSDSCFLTDLANILAERKK